MPRKQHSGYLEHQVAEIPYNGIRVREGRRCGEMSMVQDIIDQQDREIERLRSRLSEADELHAKQLAETIERLNDDYRSRLAEAERNEETLLGMIRHQRDVLRECLPYINESMAGRRPGRCADDIRAAVKALTADSATG